MLTEGLRTPVTGRFNFQRNNFCLRRIRRQPQTQSLPNLRLLHSIGPVIILQSLAVAEESDEAVSLPVTRVLASKALCTVTQEYSAVLVYRWPSRNPPNSCRC